VLFSWSSMANISLDNDSGLIGRQRKSHCRAISEGAYYCEYFTYKSGATGNGTWCPFPVEMWIRDIRKGSG